jgi:hypothetical protein
MDDTTNMPEPPASRIGDQFECDTVNPELGATFEVVRPTN